MNIYYLLIIQSAFSVLSIIFILIKLTSKMNKLSIDIRYLREKVDNDIQAQLLRVYYKFFASTDMKTQADKALSMHLRMKIDFVVSAYNEVKHYYKKNHDFSILAHSGFSSALLGSGSSDLKARYQYFPESFIESIDPLNDSHYNEFKESIMLAKETPLDDMLSVFKSISIGVFEKNVKGTINLYKKYERHIEDPDSTSIYNKVSNKPKKISSVKKLVADGKLIQALNLLEANATDEDIVDEVIQQKSILSSIMRSRRMGIEVGSEAINKIRESILEIQNQIASL